MTGFNAAFWKWFGKSKVVDAGGSLSAPRGVIVPSKVKEWKAVRVSSEDVVDKDQ